MERLEATRALQARREVSRARLNLAKLESVAQAPPAVAYMSYQNGLSRITARAESLIDKMLVSRLREPLDVVALEQGLFQLEIDLSASTNLMGERFASAAYTRTTEHARVEAQRILNVRIPRDLVGEAGAREAFIHEQLGYLNRAVSDQVQALRKAVVRFANDPTELEHQIWVIRNRNKLIARSEVWQLSEAEIERWSRLTGSEGFFYLTARDERVRPTHAAHNGKYFRWEEAPPEMGEPNCRCRKVPAEAAVQAPG